MAKVRKLEGLYQIDRFNLRVLYRGSEWPMAKVDYVKMGGEPPFSALPTEAEYRKRPNAKRT